MRWLSRLREAFASLQARREELVGINRRNVLLVYPNNARRDFPLADDKLLAKERFAAAGVPTPETLAVCDGLYAVPSTLESLQANDHFVVKPANGSGGQGILVLGERLEPGVWRKAGGAAITSLQLQRHMADILFGVYSKTLEDRVFIEQRIVPHAFFQHLWADGLCDIRVITLHAQPVMSMIRVPTAESGGRANLHQGGLGIALELETGKTYRALHHGMPIERHPESGTPLLGLQVPDWERVLEVARGAASAVPLGYLGVDIVLDQARGPLVLEINARPGLEIQNVHGSGLGKALRRLSA